MLMQTNVIRELDFYRRQKETDQNVLVILLCLDFHAVLRESHSWHYTGMAGMVLQAFTTPKQSHRTATWYSAIHHSKPHISGCLLSSGVALNTTFGGA
jgi:hypothetical protein